MNVVRLLRMICDFIAGLIHSLQSSRHYLLNQYLIIQLITVL